MGALSHIRVLDLTRVLAGPWCAQTLADLGAEVIKIERPGTGDDTRAWGPPYLKDAAGRDTTRGGVLPLCNRGKKSVTLDISTARGPGDRARARARNRDVLIENYKVGDLERYGLGYERLKAINPRPRLLLDHRLRPERAVRDRAGYDFLVQGMGGLMSITGEADDLPGGGPQKAGVAVTDMMTGMYATIAVLAALAHRERSGEGQYIDMALLDVGRRHARQPEPRTTSPAAQARGAGATRIRTSCPTRCSAPRRPHHPRGRQRLAVPQVLRGRRRARTRRGRALRDQRRARAQPRRAGADARR